MFSTVIGVVLLVLGIATFIIALIVFLRTNKKAVEPTLTQAATADIQKILEAIAKVLEQFAKLAVPVQWALLGSLNIGIGLYLLAKKPF